MTFRALAPALLLGLTALLIAVPTTAAAQDTGAPGQAGADTAERLEVELTRVDAVATAPAARVTVVARLRNAGDEIIRGGEAVLAAHRPVSSRFGLARAVDSREGPSGVVIGRSRRALPDVPAGAVRYVAVTATLAELGVTAPRAVHPLHLEIAGRVGDVPPITLARHTTALVVMTADVGRPVRTGLGVVFPTPGVPVDAATAEPLVELAGALADLDAPVSVVLDPAAAGVPPSGPAPDRGDDGAAASPSAATPSPGPPVSPSPSPTSAPAGAGSEESAEPRATGASDADADATLRSAFERLLADDDVERLLMPYARADLVALDRQGATERARTALAAGLPGTAGDTPAVVPPAGLNVAAFERLVAPLGPPAVVLAEPYLGLDPTREQPTSPSPVRPLVTAGGEATAVVPDPWLQPLLGDLGDLTPATVQRLLAETAVLYLERPETSRTRGLFLLAGGAGLVDVAGGLDAGTTGQAPRAAALVEAFAAAPWLELTDVRTLVRDVVPADPVRLAYPQRARAAELPAEYVAELEVAGEDVEAVARLLGEASPQLVQLRRELLTAASTVFRDDLAAGREIIAAVAGTAQNLFSSVEVRRQPTVTFTDERGQLPVLVANSSAVPLTVRVQLSSRRLEFGDNDREVVLEPETTTTLVFATRARTPGGTAPVVVDVTDPSGAQRLARGSIIVRIASYPLLGIVLLVGAVAVLLLWGLREWSRRGGRGDTGRSSATTRASP